MRFRIPRSLWFLFLWGGVCLAQEATPKGQQFRPIPVIEKQEKIRQGIIVADPKPVAPPAPVPPPNPVENPSKPVPVRIAPGDIAKLTAQTEVTPDSEPDKVAFIWQFPEGLNSRIDSNRQDAYVASIQPGEYKVVVVMAKNGPTRPEVWRAEILVIVGTGNAGGSPPPRGPVPTPNDDLQAAKEMYPTLIQAIKKVAANSDPEAKKLISNLYTKMYTLIKSEKLTTSEAIQKELGSQLTAPALTTQLAQQLFIATSNAVKDSVKDSDTLAVVHQKLMFLAIAETLAGR